LAPEGRGLQPHDTRKATQVRPWRAAGPPCEGAEEGRHPMPANRCVARIAAPDSSAHFGSQRRLAGEGAGEHWEYRNIGPSLALGAATIASNANAGSSQRINPASSRGCERSVGTAGPRTATEPLSRVDRRSSHWRKPLFHPCIRRRPEPWRLRRR
jgi:hypothetical protein